jgi:hypothetical protein
VIPGHGHRFGLFWEAGGDEPILPSFLRRGDDQRMSQAQKGNPSSSL